MFYEEKLCPLLTPMLTLRLAKTILPSLKLSPILSLRRMGTQAPHSSKMLPILLPPSSPHLLNIRLLKWGAAQGAFHHRPGHLQDALPQELEKEKEE